MGADETAFMTVLSMGLFTLVAIIGGYLILNSAVTNIARESSYYTFVRLSEEISQSMSAGTSGATNLYLSPRYVIFAASFSDESNLPYYEYDGQHMNDILVNLEAGSSTATLFNQVKTSSSGEKTWNDNSASQEELKKCVDDACLCIGEMSTYLLLEPEYFNAAACVEICWGENPASYDACLAQHTSSETPRTVFSSCNSAVAADSSNTACKACVNFATGSSKAIMRGKGYDLLLLSANPNQQNSINYPILQAFSEATKFAFIKSVIECRKMSEFAKDAGIGAYCAVENNQQPVPYLFNYVNSSGNSGIFAIMTTSQKLSATSEPLNNNVLFKLFNTEYYQNSGTCYVRPSFISTEVV